MGAVAEQLERELVQGIREQGILVFLDPEARAQPLVQRLQQRFVDGGFPYPVVEFDGSFLSALYALEPNLAKETVYLLLYAPGLDEATMRRSPLLEVLLAGRRYTRALPELVRLAAAPIVTGPELDRFLSTWDGALESADRWLAARASDDPRVVRMLDRELPADVAVDIMTGGKLLERHDLAIGDLHNWLQNSFGFVSVPGRDVAAEFASHVLCAEYVADLVPHRPSEPMARFRALPAAAVAACRAVAARLRELVPDEFERRALAVEVEVPSERDWAKDKPLGNVDTFRFEDEMLAQQALKVLHGADLKTGKAVRADPARALALASVRLGAGGAGGSFWVRRSESRRLLWEWIHEAALLWQHTEAPRQPRWRNLREAAEAYTETLAEVDRSHRRFEQFDARLRGLSGLEEFPLTRVVVRALRGQVRGWHDAWAGWFADLCETAGPLPPPDLQLRQVFEDDVLPRATGQEPVACFMVDALRYELAMELRDALGPGPDGSAVLKVRFAELPSETSVGMNVIPPAARAGRLSPVWSKDGIRGFRTGEFGITSKDERRKAIAQRVSMTSVPWLTLDAVIGKEPAALRGEIRGARVVVVHSREIDSAGHAGVGISHFDTLIGQLVAAFHRLNAAGVRTFVFTADHGFLLGDETAVRTPPAPNGQYRSIPSRSYASDDPEQLPERFMLRSDADTRPGWSCFSLASLDYEAVGSNPGWILFARDTRVVGPEIPTFVHGGNSLQERLVPVLCVTRAVPGAGGGTRRRVVAEVLQTSFGAHEIGIRVVDDGQGTLGFMPQDTDLVLRVTDRDDVGVVLGEVKDATVLTGGTVRVRVGEVQARVWFRLQADLGGVARVEIQGVGEALVAAVLGQPIPVIALRRTEDKPNEASAPAPAAATDWLLGLPPELAPFSAALRHLEAHQTLAEDQLVTLLGGAPVGVRLARMFSMKIADPRLRAHLPFDISIHDGGGSKQFRREVRQ